MENGFIPQHGGYKKLKSYQKTVIIYDATLYFCKRFFSNNKRQTDQMEQAARSGKQNIAEGSLASAASKKSEIFLTNVAKGSLGELQEDYEDFLRNRKLLIWEKDHPIAQEITQISKTHEDSYMLYKKYIENEYPEISANVIRHLILQAICFLLKQIQSLEADFLQNGGISERMTIARISARNKGVQLNIITDNPNPTTPTCPDCGASMIKRIAKNGKYAGNQFWGCSKYPQCKAIVNL